ncbi:hypothetical protein [Streptomyces sp. NPDC001404]|uniref:hypothetical protein n=1 Tax=Streptomyces sp. NPDC001404 TaxID=3364571 RepID=UPI0036BD3BCF
MPVPASTTMLLTLLANTALEDFEIDHRSVAASVTNDGRTSITFASSGDPTVDRTAIEQINGELCIYQRLDKLDLTTPVLVRPQDDDATLRAAADALRYLATLLDRTVSGTDQPGQVDRDTALKFAENILGGIG